MSIDDLNNALRDHIAARLNGSWTSEGTMYGAYRLHTEAGPEVYLEVGVDDDYGCPCVCLVDIDTECLGSSGTGLGTRALGVIREFCDERAVALVVEKAVSTWWNKAEHRWLALAGYDFFGDPWLLYRRDGWPEPALKLDAQRGAMARVAGVELDLD